LQSFLLHQYRFAGAAKIRLHCSEAQLSTSIKRKMLLQKALFYTFLFIITTCSFTLSVRNTSDGQFDALVRATRADPSDRASMALPTFSTGAAARCYKSWEDFLQPVVTPEWRSCFPSKTLAPSDFQPYTGTSILKTIQTIGPGSTYQDCDGITRFRFSSNASLTTSTSLITLIHHGWELGKWAKQCPPPPLHVPSCSVPREFCNDIWASYLTRDQSLAKENHFKTADTPGQPLSPCDRPAQCALDFNEEIVLLYWPPNVVSHDICKIDGIDLGRTISIPTSSVVHTITEIHFRGQDLYPLLAL
jgi:hypothetical protein